MQREGRKLPRPAIINTIIYESLFAPFNYFQVLPSAVTNSWQGGKDRSRRYTICLHIFYSNLILDKI